jgi:deoxyadenosine/deoxycytidine kinase
MSMYNEDTLVNRLNKRNRELEAENAKQKKHMKFMEETMDETGSLLDKAVAERDKLHHALEVIAGKRQTIHACMSNVDIAKAALEAEDG